MKFDNSHTQALKDFVIHLLRNCPGNSADEDILADYVIALLKYDKPRPELRRLCTSQLDDFLKEETQPFVTKLFQALSSEDYLGANKQARPNIDQPEEHTRPRPVNGSPNEDEDLNRRRHEKSPEANLHSANRRSPSPRPKNFPAPHAPTDFEPQDDNVALDEKSVKRRRPEEFVSPQSEDPSRASKMQRPLPAQNVPGPRAGPPSHQQHSPHQNYGPSASQHRRPDMTTSRGDHMGPGMVRPMHPIQGRTMHVQWPHGGPNVNFPGQQRIPPTPRGMPSVIGGGHPQDQPRGGRKPRCRDYEERGFCIRGETCPFDHGDRIIDDGSLPRPMHYNPAAFPNMAGIPGNMRPPFFVPMGGPPFESMMGNMNRVPMPVGPDSPMQPGAIPSARGTVGVPPVANAPTPAQPNFGGPRGGVRGGTGFRGNGRGRGGRGWSNGPRANFHSQKGFTLLVENIPENHCAIDKVNDFFKKFGTVTNIQVDPQNSKALVQFSNNAEAYKAYSSPEPIFDNRFVRVFWHEKEKEPSTGENSQATASSSASTSDVTGPAATVAAHAAHLAEMNAAREEKARLRKEQMEKMMEVQKQKEALIQKQIEEQKLLMEAMSKNLNIPEKEKAELMRRLESVANSVLPIATTTASSGLSTKPPSAKLAEEKERERLDRELDLLSKMGDKGPQDSSPEVTEALQAKLDQLKAEAASLGVNEYSYRGRGGGYRARGRGSWAPRGRGIGGPAAYKPYSLDLRPTKILMKSVPASVQPKLKEHFERYGDVESVSLDGGTGNAIVQYKTRHEAEKAFYNGGKFDEIPEKLEMSWYQDGVPTNNPPSSSSTAPIRPNSAVVPSSSHAHMEDVRMRDAGAESEDDDEDGERNWKRGI